MTGKTRKYVISSENEAIELLSELVNGLELEKDTEIKFEGWPKLVIRIKGKDFYGTIPTRIMPTLLELQKEVYRTYCITSYGDDNLRKLTKNDREQLELVVKVDKGSSFFEALLEEPVVKMLTSALNKMTPTQITAILIIFGISTTSLFFWKMWLAKRSKDKELDHAVEMSTLEKEKMEVISRAMQCFPTGQIISNHADTVKENFLTNLKPEDQLTVDTQQEGETPAPVNITGFQAKDLTKRTREIPVEKLVKDEFFLKSADFSKQEKIRVVLERVSDGYPFGADVPLGVLDEDQLASLKNKSWDKVNVKLDVLVKESHGKYTAAKVVAVRANSSDKP